MDSLADRKKEEKKQGFTRTEQDRMPGLFSGKLENLISHQLYLETLEARVDQGNTKMLYRKLRYLFGWAAGGMTASLATA